MFSRRKKNYRVFVYTALIISLCALIIAILWPTGPEETSVDTNVTANVNTEEDLYTNNDEPIFIPKEEPVTETPSQSYYMVKKKDDKISVFFVTDDGSQVKLEDTEIIYELLPVEDQKKFDTGIVIKDQEELSSLLQDFEG